MVSPVMTMRSPAGPEMETTIELREVAAYLRGVADAVAAYESRRGMSVLPMVALPDPATPRSCTPGQTLPSPGQPSMLYGLTQRPSRPAPDPGRLTFGNAWVDARSPTLPAAWSDLAAIEEVPSGVRLCIPELSNAWYELLETGTP